jgi:hypothetical protein
LEAPDIPSGNHQLSIEIRDPADATGARQPISSFSGKKIGGFQQKIQVGAPGEEIDLGDVPLIEPPAYKRTFP